MRYMRGTWSYYMHGFCGRIETGEHRLGGNVAERLFITRELCVVSGRCLHRQSTLNKQKP